MRRHPFDDHVLASASDDGRVFVWHVPKDFTLHTDAEEVVDVAPVSKLAGHSRWEKIRSCSRSCSDSSRSGNRESSAVC